MPLQDYSAGNVIGKGTYGVVSLVKHKKDRKQYVIKRVDIHNTPAREQKAAEQEAKLLSEVRHPNIVSYKESFQGHDGFLYIVMAFCEGGDMYTRLKTQKGKHLEERQIVEWFVQIAMALQYLHDRRILHRDLKTQNIFLTKSKIIKVGDLGIARVLENASDMATTLIGTPYYMSPELFSNTPYSYKSDVWSLGCCLYEMCTLKHAFNAKDMNSLVYKILKGKLPAMPKIYSDELCDIIKSMLAQDPERRPSVARLLRHSFIKKQIALFLEGTKNRQRKTSKEKALEEPANVPEVKSEASSKSDSGYGGMDSRKKPPSASVPPLKEREPGTEGCPVLHGDQNTDSKARMESESNRDSRSKPRREKSASDQSRQVTQHEQSHDAHKLIEKKEVSEKRSSHSRADRSPHSGNNQQDRRKARRSPLEVDGETKTDVSTDCQKSRSRPLPPKPPSRAIPEPSPNPEVKVARERRRFKVSKQADDIGGVAGATDDARDSAEPLELKPKVSSGNPTSARERRRQRERESMVGGQSALPSSINAPSSSSGKALAARLSSEGQVSQPPVKGSSYNQDSTDGPSPRTRWPENRGKSENGVAGEEIDDSSSDDSDHDENSLEEEAPESCHKPRRKESNDVSSLISALDTTLRFSEQRRSPDLDSEEPSEEQQDEPGDISVSSGRLKVRIDFLRRDCIEGLGKADFQKACDIIDTQSEDKVEEALVELMGRMKFEKYGGKIWQLKFCETFKR